MRRRGVKRMWRGERGRWEEKIGRACYRHIERRRRRRMRRRRRRMITLEITLIYQGKRGGEG